MNKKVTLIISIIIVISLLIIGVGIYYIQTEKNNGTNKETNQEEISYTKEDGIKIIIESDSSKNSTDFEFIEKDENDNYKYKYTVESSESVTTYYIVDMKNKSYKVESKVTHGG